MEVVVKAGAVGCQTATKDATDFIPVERRMDATDTTAAGDSFNAAYLHARHTGKGVTAAALQGHALAAKVIQHPGALMPFEES